MDPVTWIEEAFVSVTVSVSDCPAEMLLEPAVMETVGVEAAALAENADKAREVKTHTRNWDLIGPAEVDLSWVAKNFPETCRNDSNGGMRSSLR